MNKQQKTYALAKAAYQLAKDQIKEYEQKFIIRENVRNKDGSVPTSIWAMDEPSSVTSFMRKRISRPCVTLKATPRRRSEMRRNV